MEEGKGGISMVVELDIENEYAMVITPYNPNIIKVIKENFTRAIWNPSIITKSGKGAWIIPLENNDFEDIQRKLLIFSPILSAKASLFVKNAQEKKEKYLKALALFNQLYTGSQLKDFQKEGIRQAIKTGSFLIADEMGLGKSTQAIHLADIRNRIFNEKILITCPNSLKLQWKQEIEKWLPEVSDEIQIIEGQKKKRAELWNNDKKWSIVSYETLRNDKPNLSNYFIIGDEISRCKSSKSLLYFTMERARKEASDVLLLTGTPLENSLSDFHNILNIVKPNWMSKNKFYGEYCVWDFIEVNGRDYRKIVGFKGIEEFRKEALPYFIRRTKEEVTDLLPKNYEVRKIPLTKCQESIEYQLKTLVKGINNNTTNTFGLFALLRINAAHPMALKESKSEIAKNLQIDGGSGKIDEVKDILQELGFKEKVKNYE